jgi:Tfp pilus assembly protein PilZ
MNASDIQLDRYSLIPRLFKLVNGMSEERQLVLLRQLLKDNVKKHLFKVIIDMSDSRQLKLLEQLEKLPSDEMPVRTVSLDEEEETSMRGHLRKPCLINVAYTIQDHDYKGYILDISTVGVFIETNEPFSVGQELTLAFSLPSYEKVFNLQGLIVWIGHQGIGVKFQNLLPDQEDFIKSFIEKG